MTRFFDSTTIDETEDDCGAFAELAHSDCADVATSRDRSETDAFTRDYCPNRQVIDYPLGWV